MYLAHAPRNAAAGCGAAVIHMRRSLASGFGRHWFVLGRSILTLMAQGQHVVRADISMALQRLQTGSQRALLQSIDSPALPFATSSFFATLGATSYPCFQTCSTGRARLERCE